MCLEAVGAQEHPLDDTTIQVVGRIGLVFPLAVFRLDFDLGGAGAGSCIQTQMG